MVPPMFSTEVFKGFYSSIFIVDYKRLRDIPKLFQLRLFNLNAVNHHLEKVKPSLLLLMDSQISSPGDTSICITPVTDMSTYYWRTAIRCPSMQPLGHLTTVWYTPRESAWEASFMAVL